MRRILGVLILFEVLVIAGIFLRVPGKVDYKKFSDDNAVPRSFLIAQGDPVEISDIPRELLTKLVWGEFRKALLVDNYGPARAVTYHGKEISYTKYSSGKDKIGFYYESSNYGTAEDLSLVIFDIPTRTMKEVYKGSYRTSFWEWNGEYHVIVYYGCGTQCLYAYKINIETGQRESEYHVYE